MKIACSTLSFDGLPLSDALERIKALGFEYVDLGVQEKWAHIYPSSLLRDFKQTSLYLANLLRKTGLKVVSFNVNIIASTWDSYIKYFEPVCRLAGFLEVFLITIPALSKGSDLRQEIERAKYLLRICRMYNVKLTYETFIGTLTEDPRVALDLVQAVPGLGLTLDPSHYISLGLSEEEFSMLYPYVLHVHLKDAELGFDHLQVPVGKGVVPFSKIVAGLSEVGYSGVFTIEYFDPARFGGEQFDHVEEIKKLRELLLAIK